KAGRAWHFEATGRARHGDTHGCGRHRRAEQVIASARPARAIAAHVARLLALDSDLELRGAILRDVERLVNRVLQAAGSDLPSAQVSRLRDLEMRRKCAEFIE